MYIGCGHIVVVDILTCRRVAAVITGDVWIPGTRQGFLGPCDLVCDWHRRDGTCSEDKCFITYFTDGLCVQCIVYLGDVVNSDL